MKGSSQVKLRMIYPTEKKIMWHALDRNTRRTPKAAVDVKGRGKTLSKALLSREGSQTTVI
jgi:hypothetical protein